MERIFDLDAKITLAGIQVFRQNSFAAGTFCRRHNHPIVEVYSVLPVSFDCTPHRVAIHFDQSNRTERVQHRNNLCRRGSRCDLVEQRGCELR